MKTTAPTSLHLPEIIPHSHKALHCTYLNEDFNYLLNHWNIWVTIQSCKVTCSA